MYAYNIWQWILFFYIYCFFGWIFESAYVSLCKRRFVNRGFLRLPMLPLYGSGAVLMLWISIPVRDNLVLTWLFGALGATALEYIVGISMEAIFKVKYWDYSKQPFNFQGVICLSSTIAWGVLTIFLTRLIHPPVESWVLSMEGWAVILCDVVISLLFVTDAIISVKAALDLSHMLARMEKIRAEFDRLQVQFALGKMEGRDMLDEWRDAFMEQINERIPEKLSRLIRENKEKMDFSHFRESLKEYDLLNGKMDRIKKSLLRANPSASSRWFNEELVRMKKQTEEQFREKKEEWKRKLRKK